MVAKYAEAEGVDLTALKPSQIGHCIVFAARGA